MKYKRKEEIVNVEQWHGEKRSDITFISTSLFDEKKENIVLHSFLLVNPLNSRSLTPINIGDYITTNQEGLKSVCSQESFKELYEKIDDYPQIKCVVCSQILEREDHYQIRLRGGGEIILEPESDAWSQSGVHLFVPGYGSKFDMKQFIIGVCDECIEYAIKDKRLIEKEEKNGPI